MLPSFSFCNVSVAFATLIILSLAVKCKTYFIRIYQRYSKRVPPGPTAFPVLGTITIDPKRPDLSFRKWAKQYGKMYSFFLGDRFCIAIGDLDIIKRLFKEDRFVGRSHGGILPLLANELHRGIVLNDGELWKVQRRFSLSALRDFGFGKATGAERIQEEATNLLNHIKAQSGKPFDPRLPFANSVSNVIAFMLFGDCFPPTDKRFNMFVEYVALNMKELLGAAGMEVYPWLRHIPPFKQRYDAINARTTASMTVLRDLVKDHKKSFDPANPRDYIDAFFCIQKEQRNSSHNFTDEQLIRNLGDLFIAGFETTTTFLRWAMVYMMLHPEIQGKVQAELDSVIGHNRLPVYNDRGKLPYTDAVTIELFRITSFIPFGVAHRALEDVEVEGYLIPKDADVWPLFCHHFHNPEVWGDPETFRPERFFDNKGAVNQALADEVQPFSIGKRACLGEPLARMEVFGFFASILQKFTVKSVSGNPPSVEPVTAAVLAPQPFQMIAVPRV